MPRCTPLRRPFATHAARASLVVVEGEHPRDECYLVEDDAAFFERIIAITLRGAPPVPVIFQMVQATQQRPKTRPRAQCATNFAKRLVVGRRVTTRRRYRFES